MNINLTKFTNKMNTTHELSVSDCLQLTNIYQRIVDKQEKDQLEKF